MPIVPPGGRAFAINGLMRPSLWSPNMHQSKAKPINILRGEGGAEWMGGPLRSPAVPLRPAHSPRIRPLELSLLGIGTAELHLLFHRLQLCFDILLGRN